MCRQYIFKFTDCGHEPLPRPDHLFRCDISPCPGAVTIEMKKDRFCPHCLMCNHNTMPLYRNLGPALSRFRYTYGDNDKLQARRIFALVPENGPSNYQMIFEDGSRHQYSAWDPSFFSSYALSLYDGMYLADAELALMPRILHLWSQYPSSMTFNMLMLYLQIRDAWYMFDIRQKERSLLRQEDKEARRQGISIHDEMIRNLPNVSFNIDVEFIPEDHRNCLICQEEMEKPAPDGTPAERALKLPCDHIYGEDCLKQWIRSWDPEGPKFSLCTLCREDFSLTPVREEPEEEEVYEEVYYATNTDPHPDLPCPWFMQWLRKDPTGHGLGFYRSRESLIRQ
jgi:hypothetical protein